MDGLIRVSERTEIMENSLIRGVLVLIYLNCLITLFIDTADTDCLIECERVQFCIHVQKKLNLFEISIDVDLIFYGSRPI